MRRHEASGSRKSNPLEGDLDLRGVLGIDPQVRKEYQQIHMTFDHQSRCN
jgi:hypothetical protein